MITINKKDFQELFDISCKDWKKKFKEKFVEFLFVDTISFEESFLDEMETACTKEQLPIFKKIFKEYQKEDLFSISGYSEVCKRLNERELTESDFNHLPEYLIRKNLMFSKLQQIAKLFNGNWKVNILDSNQHKWYNYFSFSVAGGGLVFDCSGRYDRYCYGGMVVYFKDKKTANFIGNHPEFIKLYQELYS